MYTQGMLELLTAEVIAQGHTVATNGRSHWAFIVGDNLIVVKVPSNDWDLNRLIGDLVDSGLHWPPSTRR